MSIFEQIRKTAQNAAKDGLALLGLNLSHVTVPDDEDTRSRDIFDFYRDIVEKSQEGTRAVSVPDAMHDALRGYVNARCGRNLEVKAIVENWLNDRRSFYKTASALELFELRDAYCELDGILEDAGIVQIVPAQTRSWLGTAQAVAAAQQLHIYNLLLQSCRQFMDFECFDGDAGCQMHETDQASETDGDVMTLDQWCGEMNSRLGRFGYQIAVSEMSSDAGAVWKMSILNVPGVSD